MCAHFCSIYVIHWKMVMDLHKLYMDRKRKTLSTKICNNNLLIWHYMAHFLFLMAVVKNMGNHNQKHHVHV